MKEFWIRGDGNSLAKVEEMDNMSMKVHFGHEDNGVWIPWTFTKEYILDTVESEWEAWKKIEEIYKEEPDYNIAILVEKEKKLFLIDAGEEAEEWKVEVVE